MGGNRSAFRRWQIWMRSRDPYYLWTGRDPERRPPFWVGALGALIGALAGVVTMNVVGPGWVLIVLPLLIAPLHIAAHLQRRRRRHAAGRTRER